MSCLSALLSIVVFAFISTFSFEAEAEGPEGGPVGLGPNAMPELFDTEAPTRSGSTLAVAASAGYGYIDQVGTVSEAHRVSGRVAVAYGLSPAFRVGLSFRGHLDAFPGSSGGINGVAEPRLRGQIQVLETKQFQLGFSAQVRFVGAGAPSISWEATSPSIRALLAARLGSSTQLVANLGFELDRSIESVDNFESLNDEDRITLGISRGATVPIGLGVSTYFGQGRYQALVEVFGRPAVGDAAPSFFESPWAVRLGFRPQLLPSLSASAGLELGISSRASGVEATRSGPIEPRVGLMAGLIWAPAKSKPKPPPPAPPPPPKVSKEVTPKPPEQVELAVVEGRVITESGTGIENAEVRVSAEGKWLGSGTTDADGHFTVAKLPVASRYELTIEASDFDSVTTTAERGAAAEITLYRSLPRGAIEGRVTDYRGAPLAAKIHILPGDLEIASSEDGTFAIELAPGKYTLTFEVAGFRAETRIVQVEDKGVFIQNLALGK